MTNSQRLRLYEIADRLDRYEIDNGPMGSSSPFKDEARELREMARGSSDSGQRGDFRDEPWPQR